MAFTIKVEPTNAALTIGDDYKKTNRIAFTISLQGDERVWVALQIPLGESGVLRQPEDANDVEVLVDGRPMPRSDRNDPKEWWLVDADNGLQIDPGKPTKLDVSVNNVLCRASAGDSKLTVLVSRTSGDEPPEQITIAKAKPTALLATNSSLSLGSKAISSTRLSLGEPVAIVLAAVNMVGGFVVTDRMLEMFSGRNKEPRP
jgi:hypothetical protein